MSRRRIRSEGAGKVAAVAVGGIALLLALPSLLRTDPPEPPPDVGLLAPAPPSAPAPAIAPPPPAKPAEPKRPARKRTPGWRRQKHGRARDERGGEAGREDAAERGEQTAAVPVTSGIARPPAVAYAPVPARERFGFER